MIPRKAFGWLLIVFGFSVFFVPGYAFYFAIAGSQADRRGGIISGVVSWCIATTIYAVAPLMIRRILTERRNKSASAKGNLQ